MLPTFLSLIVLFIWQTDIRNWIRNIEQHASDNVNKILVGNKADTDESKRVSTQAPLILLYDLLIL
jgi:GTPase SAR1 family protein